MDLRDPNPWPLQTPGEHRLVQAIVFEIDVAILIDVSVRTVGQQQSTGGTAQAGAGKKPCFLT